MATASMSGRLRRFWQAVAGPGNGEVAVAPSAGVTLLGQASDAEIDIAANDPILAYFATAPGPVEIDKLALDSPALRAMQAAGIKLAVPLVSQGELIGLLNLGPRLSEQDYSSDDRKLLERLAAQAAPAVRVAQLVREQQEEARERQRIESELEVARLIQQNYLPKELPTLPGWRFGAFYRPAREVGGDFYDFIELEDGHLGLVIGDVTGKGVPAALIMAATRSMLRASAQQAISPGEVLERVNELMCPDTPPNMFVTCFYAVLQPATGRMLYANAGQNLPYAHTSNGVIELKARGMPLGLMPGMPYEEKEVQLESGACVLFHSDGLGEAHNGAHEMFGFPRVKELVGAHAGDGLIVTLLEELERFTGSIKEPEDDVTLVMLARDAEPSGRNSEGGEEVLVDEPQVLAEFSLPSEPGNERLAMERVAEVVSSLGLADRTFKRLKTAVAEATMNAIEHGNQNRPELPVDVRVVVSRTRLTVEVTDQGGHHAIPETGTPDLEAKLAGLDRPRGWGLFLIKNMVDEMEVGGDEHHHTIQLTLHLEGGADGNQGL